MTPRILLGLLLAAPLAVGQDAKPVRLAIQAARIHPVSSAPLDQATLLVENGKIAGIREGHEAPAGWTVIDARAKSIIPGLLDALVPEEETDAEAVISPDVRAIDGYDVFRDHRKLLEGGITTVHLSPGRTRLIAGRGAVVKVAGTDRRARVLREIHGLRANVGDIAKSPPPTFKPPIPASAENPLKPMKAQPGASRMGQFGELRRAFERALDVDSELTRGSREALAEVLAGKQPLAVSARSSDDILRILRLAEELKLRLLLLDGDEADQVADVLAGKNIPVWLDSAIVPGRGVSEDPSRPPAEYARNPGAAARLLKAGIPVALQSSEEGSRRELLLAALACCRDGLDPEAALRLVTLAPAGLLGVQDRVGSLEKGKDADFVILGGPLTSTHGAVDQVWVDGVKAWERTPEMNSSMEVASRAGVDPEGKLLAIRGATIHTGGQGVVPGGLILVAGNRIVYVGKDKPVPPGTEVLDADGLTALPGAIDIHGHLGFHVDGSERAVRGRQVRPGVPPQLNDPPSSLLRLDDPVFREAALAGVTTVLVAPEGAGVCSLVKTAGAGTQATILRDVAAIKMGVSGGAGGPQAAKDFLSRARKYHDEWESWERFTKEKPATPPAPGPPPDALSGTWSGSARVPEYEDEIPFTIEMKLAGNAVTGTLTANAFGQNLRQDFRGSFTAPELKIEHEVEGARLVFTATVSGETLKGKFEIRQDGMRIAGTASARRAAPPSIGPRPGPAPTPAPGDRKEPAKEESLDPWRRVFRREVPVLVVARDLNAIEAAAAAFQEQGLDWILLAPNVADHAVSSIPAAILGPDFLRERRGRVANLAEALVGSGIPVAFASNSVAGASRLTLTAFHAARWGLDPAEAWKSVTRTPARLLGLEGRLGSLERGRDADIVFYSGDPFDLGSRIRMVVSNGKVVLK